MPIEVEAIRNRRASCTVELGPGASVAIEYLPLQVAAFMARSESGDLSESDTLAESVAALARELEGIATAWDVTRGGEPFPLEAEELAATFDIGFLSRCLGGITTHYAESKGSGELLSTPGTATISPKAGAESSPNGATAGSRASRRNARSPRSRSSAGSRRGILQSIQNGRTSSGQGYRQTTAS